MIDVPDYILTTDPTESDEVNVMNAWLNILL
jgi:hypothetical protein